MIKRLISVCAGTYNEEDNIEFAWQRITAVMKDLDNYEYEIIFSDNDSKDNTRKLLRELCQRDSHVKAIFNSRNFGPSRSGMNMITASNGDAVIVLPADMQDPPELIPEFIKYWEEGYPLVLGQREGSANSRVDRGLRSIYYSIIDRFSDVPQKRQVSGFGLYDRSVINKLDEINDYNTDIRFQLADLGYRTKLIPYEQSKRKYGKSSYNWYRFFDFGLISLLSTSRKPLRIMTMLGLVASLVFFFIGVFYLIAKLIFWDNFIAGSAPILIGVFFIGSVQVLFLGMLGEYIGLIDARIRSRGHPYVVEDERINFNTEHDDATDEVV